MSHNLCIQTDIHITSNVGNISLTPVNSTNTSTITINTLSNIIDIKDGATSNCYIQSSGLGTAIESANALFLTSVGDTTLQATTGQVLCNQTPTTVDSVDTRSNFRF